MLQYILAENTTDSLMIIEWGVIHETAWYYFITLTVYLSWDEILNGKVIVAKKNCSLTHLLLVTVGKPPDKQDIVPSLTSCWS